MKRIFISAFVGFIAFGFFLWSYLVLAHFSLAYLGALIGSVSGLLYFLGIYTFGKSSNNIAKTSYYGFGVYVGLIVVMFSLYQNPIPVQYFAGLYAALNLVMWQKYLNWYSVYGERDINILVDKELKTKGNVLLNGDVVSASTLLEKPSVWIFFRGNWCPFCVAQVEEVAGQYNQITELGYSINFVSNQNEIHTQSLANKLGVDVNFVIDTNSTFSKNLGLQDDAGLPWGLTVLNYKTEVLYPAIIITDKKGIVRFFDVTDNYRDRMPTEQIIEELQRFCNTTA